MVEDKNAPSYVIDCSVICSTFLPDETPSSQIKLIFRKFSQNKAKFFAPSILKHEISNVFKTAYTRKRLDNRKILELYSQFLLLPIHYFDPKPTATLSLAIENNLSYYDALYLLLSIEKNIPLLTLDKKLLSIYVLLSQKTNQK